MNGRGSLGRSRAFQTAAAILAGVVAAPLVLILSERLPILGAVLLYGALAYFFAFLLPGRSWRWGCWVSLGIPVAVLAAIAAGVVNPPEPPYQRPEILGPHTAFLGVAALLGYIPGLFGGVVGAVLGAYTRKRNEPTG